MSFLPVWKGPVCPALLVGNDRSLRAEKSLLCWWLVVIQYHHLQWLKASVGSESNVGNKTSDGPAVGHFVHNCDGTAGTDCSQTVAECAM